MPSVVEIESIDTKYMCLIVTALREANMKSLAEVFMLWSFEIEWEEIPELTDEQKKLVELILQKTCDTYCLKIDDTEFKQLDLPVETDETEEIDELPLVDQLKVSIDKFVTDQWDVIISLINERIPRMSDILCKFRDSGVQTFDINEISDSQIQAFEHIVNTFADVCVMTIGSRQIKVIKK